MAMVSLSWDRETRLNLKTRVGECTVSTVEVNTGYRYTWARGEPREWETLVLGTDLLGKRRRYGHDADAYDGHWEMVRWLRSR